LVLTARFPDSNVALVRRLIHPLGWLIRPDWFVTNVATLPIDGATALPPGVSIRRGSPADAAMLEPLAHARQSAAWRFARGDIVLIAQMHGRVIGCTWLTTRSLRPWYFPIFVRLAPGDWYNYGLVLVPEQRVRGLGRAMSRHAMHEVMREGGSRVIGHARRFDAIAARSHVSAGFVTVEELIGVTLLNRVAVVLYRRPRARAT
jgi:hypothetical protein